MNTNNPVEEILYEIGSHPGVSYSTLLMRLSEKAVELLDCLVNDESVELGFDFMLDELIDVETSPMTSRDYEFFLTDLGEQAFEEILDHE